jgi:hypothetical protein
MSHAHLAVPPSYQDFFALWKDADADIPILLEAKREYEKLK